MSVDAHPSVVVPLSFSARNSRCRQSVSVSGTSSRVSKLASHIDTTARSGYHGSFADGVAAPGGAGQLHDRHPGTTPARRRVGLRAVAVQTPPPCNTTRAHSRHQRGASGQNRTVLHRPGGERRFGRRSVGAGTNPQNIISSIFATVCCTPWLRLRDGPNVYSLTRLDVTTPPATMQATWTSVRTSRGRQLGGYTKT